VRPFRVFFCCIYHQDTWTYPYNKGCLKLLIYET
jgi:hypothetical protein